MTNTSNTLKRWMLRLRLKINPSRFSVLKILFDAIAVRLDDCSLRLKDIAEPF
jgi:hypothetical protein